MTLNTDPQPFKQSRAARAAMLIHWAEADAEWHHPDLIREMADLLRDVFPADALEAGKLENQALLLRDLAPQLEALETTLPPRSQGGVPEPLQVQGGGVCAPHESTLVQSGAWCSTHGESYPHDNTWSTCRCCGEAIALHAHDGKLEWCSDKTPVNVCPSVKGGHQPRLIQL